MQIQIVLLSDTLPGTGSSRTEGIDRDLVFTSTGLPYLPARRIKGCLREASKEVSESLSLIGRSDIWNETLIKALFGETGKSYAGWLQLSSAYLEDSIELENWLQWINNQSEFSDYNYFGPEAVLNQYTGLRAQTRISRKNGGAMPNSLRVSRVLKRGLTFKAKVELIAPADPKAKSFDISVLQFGLALSTAAWQRMGLSRNRGLGEIECRVYDEKNVDLTIQKLQELENSLTLTNQIDKEKGTDR